MEDQNEWGEEYIYTELALVCEIGGDLKTFLDETSKLWKTFSTFYSKNPPLDVSFEGDISENEGFSHSLSNARLVHIQIVDQSI